MIRRTPVRLAIAGAVIAAATLTTINGASASVSTGTAPPLLTSQDKAMADVQRLQALPTAQGQAEFLKLPAAEQDLIRKMATPDPASSTVTTTYKKTLVSDATTTSARRFCADTYAVNQARGGAPFHIKLYKTWQAVHWCWVEGARGPYSSKSTNRGGSVQLGILYSHPGNASNGWFNAGWEHRYYNEERYVMLKYGITFEHCVQVRVGINGWSWRPDCEVAAP